MRIFFLGLFESFLVLNTTPCWAVTLTLPYPSFTAGSPISASQMNQNFGAIATAFSGTVSSQWTTSGSNLYYSSGNIVTNAGTTTTPAYFVSTMTNYYTNGGVLDVRGAGVFGTSAGQATLYLVDIPGARWMINTSGYQLNFVSDGGNGSGNAGKSFASTILSLYASGGAAFTGNVTANGSQLSSDRKFKESIAALEDPDALLLRLHPIVFKWKSKIFPEKAFDDRQHMGFIAQEVQDIAPDLVYKDRQGALYMDYNALIAPLVAAYQKLYKSHEALKKGSSGFSVHNL